MAAASPVQQIHSSEEIIIDTVESLKIEAQGLPPKQRQILIKMIDQYAARVFQDMARLGLGQHGKSAEEMQQVARFWQGKLMEFNQFVRADHGEILRKRAQLDDTLARHGEEIASIRPPSPIEHEEHTVTSFSLEALGEGVTHVVEGSLGPLFGAGIELILFFPNPQKLVKAPNATGFSQEVRS